MKINGKKYLSVWKKDSTLNRSECDRIQIIDQRALPHELIFEDLDDSEIVTTAIVEMHLRGAPLIGIVAAFGVYFAFKESYANQDELFDSENCKQAFIEKVEKISNLLSLGYRQLSP